MDPTHVKDAVEFPMHTPDTAPERSREIMANAKKKYGFVPNLMGVMADAPAALRGYWGIGSEFAESSLTPIEQQVVILTVSRLNGCTYCMGAHSAVAKMAGIPDDELAALRDDEALSDPRFKALSEFTRAVVEKRGWASPEDLDAFLTAGYTRPQILEVITGIAYKTLSNYTNHITGTLLDPAFEAFRWEPEGKATTGDA